MKSHRATVHVGLAYHVHVHVHTESTYISQVKCCFLKFRHFTHASKFVKFNTQEIQAYIYMYVCTCTTCTYTSRVNALLLCCMYCNSFMATLSLKEGWVEFVAIAVPTIPTNRKWAWLSCGQLLPIESNFETYNGQW